MATRRAKPSEIIDASPLGSALAKARTRTLVKTDSLEVIRLVVPAGRQVRTHKVAGEITVQCLEGRVAFTADATTRDLAAGQLLYLSGNQPHSLRGIDDASLLLTILLKKRAGK